VVSLVISLSIFFCISSFPRSIVSKEQTSYEPVHMCRVLCNNGAAVPQQWSQITSMQQRPNWCVLKNTFGMPVYSKEHIFPVLYLLTLLSCSLPVPAFWMFSNSLRFLENKPRTSEVSVKTDYKCGWHTTSRPAQNSGYDEIKRLYFCEEEENNVGLSLF
jgi:hypothetical protein